MTNQLIDTLTEEPAFAQQEADVPATEGMPEADSAAEPQKQVTESASPEAILQERLRKWASLPMENFRMLRLAPLPADRNTGLRPLQFACLGSVSRHSKELSMLGLQVELPGQKNKPGINRLEVWVNHLEKEIRFLPEAGLSVEPGNRGLGRLLMATAAGWCSPHWNDYRIQQISLPARQVTSEAGRLRRDHALQAQGFIITYTDSVQMNALCSAFSLEQINTGWNRNKVRIIEHLEAAHLLQSADLNLKAQASHINRQRERIELLQRDDNKLKFTIFTLIFFAIFQALLLIWMATR